MQRKWRQKSYQRYSGYPGGQRDEVAWKLFERRPERILELAIQRMMPKSKLGRHMMDKLKLYVGADHPHQAQGPIPLEALSGRPASAGALFKSEVTAKAPASESQSKASSSEPQQADAAAPPSTEPAALAAHAEPTEAQPQATTGDVTEPTSTGEATQS